MYKYLLPISLLFATFPACQPADAPPDVVPTPTFKYVKAGEGGCGDVFFHKGNAAQTEFLWISARKAKLKLPAKGTVTFDLAKSPDGLQVAIDLWEKKPRFQPYCNDIADSTKKLATWKATSGKLTLTIYEPVAAGENRYHAGAKLEDVIFEDAAGNKATLKEETITKVIVGWYAG